MKQPSFDIIYEDEDILVLNKAPFVLTIPDRYAPEKFNLYNYLGKHYGPVYVVHRLDKETSGLLVFARNSESHMKLSEYFRLREVKKIYHVLVEGRIYVEEGVIDKPIAPDPSNPDRIIVTAGGKPSITHYRVLEYFKNFTLVEADIKTGRTHQIRVHFKSIGYPLAVDSYYGRKQAFMLSDVKRNGYVLGKDQEERPLLARTSLHAFSIDFQHPITNEPKHFEAILPKDFSAVLKQLRKWGK